MEKEPDWTGISRHFSSHKQMHERWGEGHYITGAPELVALQERLEARYDKSVYLTHRGMASIQAVVSAFIGPRDRIFCSEEVYPGTIVLLKEWERKGWIGDVVYFDPHDLEWLKKKKEILVHYEMVFVESVGNSRCMKVADIPAILSICKDAGAILVVDTTFTPFLTFSPDPNLYEVASITKYEVPDDEVTGGRIVAAKENIEKLSSLRFTSSMSMQPIAARYFLTVIDETEARFKQHCQNARALVEVCQGHKAIAEVHHPSLDEGPETGMICIVLAGGDEAAKWFVDVLVADENDWSISVSFGTSDWRAICVDESWKNFFGYRPGLVRISAGRVRPEENIAAFKAALDKSIPK